MTGRRTRRWFDRLRAALGRGPSSREGTSLDGFSARSRPPAVTNPPPNAMRSAPAAHHAAADAPSAATDDGATEAAEDPAATDAGEATETPVAGEAPASSGAAETAQEPASDDATATSDPPPVRVHTDRLGRRVAPMELSPTEALRLADQGRAGLARRELPPDHGPRGSGDTDEP